MPSSAMSRQAATTADWLAVSGPCRVAGIRIHETGVGTATVDIRDGLDATGRLVMTVPVIAGEQQNLKMYGCKFGQGVFIDRTGTGTTEITVFVEQG